MLAVANWTWVVLAGFAIGLACFVVWLSSGGQPKQQQSPGQLRDRQP